MADMDGNTPGRVSRRGFLKYTGAGAAGVALAGCQEQPDETPGGGSTVTGGGGSEPAPLQGQTVRIGTLAPQPESLPLGSSILRSAVMAAEKLNSEGVAGTDTDWTGIAGAEVKVPQTHDAPLSGNTEVSPGTGREEFYRLVQEENVDATVGVFLTQVLLQLLQPISQTQTIHLTTGAAGPKASRIVSKDQRYDEFKYHFRPGPINSFDLAKAELEFVRLYADRLGWERVAVLTENINPFDPFQEGLEQGFGGEPPLEELVDDVPIFKRTSSGTTDWTPVFDEVEAADVDIALVHQALTGTTSVKQWFNQKRDFEMGGIHVPDQVYEYWGEVDGACRYTFTMNAVTPQTTNTPRTQPYMKRYQKKYDTFPTYTGPITYDAVRIYAQAMETAVVEEGLSTVPDSDTMVEYLEDLTFTNGIVLPKFQFTPPEAKYAHDPKWTCMAEDTCGEASTGVPVYQQWQLDPEITEDYGVMHSFAPEQNQTAEYSFPHWIDYPDDHPANDPDAFGKQPGENP